MDYLNYGIDLAQQVVDTAPGGDPLDLTYGRTNLGFALGIRYRQLWKIEDLHRAIEAQEMALAIAKTATMASESTQTISGEKVKWEYLETILHLGLGEQ